MPIDEGEHKTHTTPGHNHSGGVWVDCMLKILGWFQLTGQVNPVSGNFIPEAGPDGLPISGPGWTAYEKPGAQAGDVVIIYQLNTILASGTAPTANQIAGVLWQLLNPTGVCYFATNYSLKSCVSPTDLVTFFPHPGGLLSPINPDNPNGDPDVLWRRVTTQYGLPGPGNAQVPQLIRQVMPGFGVRMLVWTPDCCVHHHMTTLPPVPPTIPPPPPPPPPKDPPYIPGVPTTNVPTTLAPGGTVVVVPGGPTVDPGGTSISPHQPFPGVINVEPHGPSTPSTGDPNVNVTPVIGPGVSINSPDPVGGGKAPMPSSHKSQVQGNVCHRPGSAPPPRGGSPQGSYYDVPDAIPLPYVNKVGENDFNIISRARPVGNRYMQIKEAGRNPMLMKSRVNWSFTMDRGALESLGLIPPAPRHGARAQLGGEKVSPTSGGKSDTTSSKPAQRHLERGTTRGPGGISDPIRRHGTLDNQPIIEQTIGGFSQSPGQAVSDITPERFEKIRPDLAGGQKISMRKRAKILSHKLQKQTQKGDQLADQAGRLGHASLRRRTIDITRNRQATRQGQAQAAALKFSGPSLSNLRKVKDVVSFEQKEDPSGQFKIVPVSYRGGDEWAFLTMVIGDVMGEKHVVLNQTAMVYTDDGVITANMGSSGCMQFGRVNPPLPGMYVIANPSCIPGQGSLPNIIAGGQTWNFMTLVLTLTNLENQIIAQQVMSFLPAFGGDTDVIAPNRLPFGLMRDLEISQSSSFLYDGTHSARATDQNLWYQHEPSVIVERTGPVGESVAVVLKATVTSQGQSSPFRPLLEIYDDTVLQASGPAAAFVSGPCTAGMGWIDPITGTALTSGGIHTACSGMGNTGGAGGTSAYVVDQFGIIQSGPYNPGVYAGSHNCFLYFRYDPTNASGSDSNSIAASSTKYRIRTYNNGPVSDTNGFVLYTQGLKISAASGSLTINTAGEVEGTLTTYHCAQILRVRNDNTGQEVERLSSWQNGQIYIGANSTAASRLNGSIGDVIKIYRPGYDNLYNSGFGVVVAQYTVA